MHAAVHLGEPFEMKYLAAETLDPNEREATCRIAHRMVDEAIEHLVPARGRLVLTPMPDEVRARLQTGMPQQPAPLDSVYDEYWENVAACAIGNIHPRFWGSYSTAR